MDPLTLRDQFACAALTVVALEEQALTKRDQYGAPMCAEYIAERAYEIADAMLEARAFAATAPATVG